MNDLAVILINWNNYDDTIECLKSLRDQDLGFFTTVIVDNGSTNDSVLRIQEAVNGHETLVVNYSKSYDDAIEIEEVDPPLTAYRFVIIKCKENFGFAKANNVGIKYAIAGDYKAVMLLNNDTVLSKSCLRLMYERLFADTRIEIVIPTIYYYDNPEKIWNCGGEPIAFGRKKHYAMSDVRSHAGISEYETKLVTGCALMVRKEVFVRYGVLDDGFFFGEEDTEFSLRMNKENVKMLCMKEAVMWHKVSSSQPKSSWHNRISKTILEYTNRLVRYRRSHTALQTAIVFEIYNSLLLVICMRAGKRNLGIKEMRELSALFRRTASNTVVDRAAYYYIMSECNRIIGALNG